MLKWVTLQRAAEILNKPLKTIIAQCPDSVINAGRIPYRSLGVFLHLNREFCNLHPDCYLHKHGCMQCLMKKQTRSVVTYEEFKAKRFPEPKILKKVG